MFDVIEILNGYPKKHGKTIEELADIMGYTSASALARQLNPNDDRPFPLRKLIPIILACNRDFTVLDHIEARLGRVAVDISGKEKTTLCLDSVATLAKEAGEAIACTAGSLEDGIISEAEKKHCVKELLDLAQHVNGLIMWLTQNGSTVSGAV